MRRDSNWSWRILLLRVHRDAPAGSRRRWLLSTKSQAVPTLRILHELLKGAVSQRFFPALTARPFPLLGAAFPLPFVRETLIATLLAPS